MLNRRKLLKVMRDRLSPARYRHAVGVARTAVRLARRYGVDPDKAWLAGLLHDYAREMPEEECLRLAGRYALLADVSQPTVALLHGPLGAALLRDELGIDDPEVLQAVARHTTGDTGMSGLDKVVYLADVIEPGRDHAGVEALRKLARRDLDRAVLAAMDATLAYLRGHGQRPDPRTLLARQDIAAGMVKGTE